MSEALNLKTAAHFAAGHYAPLEVSVNVTEIRYDAHIGSKQMIVLEDSVIEPRHVRMHRQYQIHSVRKRDAFQRADVGLATEFDGTVFNRYVGGTR